MICSVPLVDIGSPAPCGRCRRSMGRCRPGSWAHRPADARLPGVITEFRLQMVGVRTLRRSGLSRAIALDEVEQLAARGFDAHDRLASRDAARHALRSVRLPAGHPGSGGSGGSFRTAPGRAPRNAPADRRACPGPFSPGIADKPHRGRRRAGHAGTLEARAVGPTAPMTSAWARVMTPMPRVRCRNMLSLRQHIEIMVGALLQEVDPGAGWQRPARRSRRTSRRPGRWPSS